MGNHGVSSVQDGLGRSIILFQTDQSASPVLRLKFQNVLNGGATESVNTLVVITYYTDIFMPTCQQSGKQILHMVGILILVHQDISELTLVIAANIFVLLKKLYRNEDNIIKVQCVVVFELSLILFIGFCNVQGTEIPVAFRSVQHFLRREHSVFAPADSCKNILCGECFVVQPHIFDDLLDHALGIGGIINGKAPAVAHALDIPAQNAAAGRVKGHGPDILSLRPEQHGKTLFHLVGSFVGEGNGQNAPGCRRFYSTKVICHPTLTFIQVTFQRFQEQNIFFCYSIRNLVRVRSSAETHQICDSVNQHSGLTASCTCKQQQGSLRGQHSLTLHIVQRRKLAFYVFLSRCEKSIIQCFVHSRTNP